MAKKVMQVVKIQLEAGKANPAPPVGTALGPTGVNIMQFCKEYNALTQGQSGMIIPVEISIYEDRSFSLVTKTPPAANLIKKEIGLKKGSGEPNKKKVGTISREKIKSIAELKMKDMSAANVEAAMKTIEGTAKSMGVTVED